MDVDLDEGRVDDDDNDEDASSDEEDNGTLDTVGANNMEPTRLQPADTGTDIDQEHSPDVSTTAANRVYDASCRLLDIPIVTRFPGDAGKVYGVEELTEDESYHSTIGTPGGIYAPFSSKKEWELAKWAKERGSSSTAFTDLMSIEGVRKNI
jgi:hypothetical protein